MNLALKELLNSLSCMNLDDTNDIKEVGSVGLVASVESVSKTLESDALNFVMSDDFQIHLSALGLNENFIASFRVLLKKSLSREDFALHDQLLHRLLNVKKAPMHALTQTPQNVETDQNTIPEVGSKLDLDLGLPGEETRQLSSNFELAYIVPVSEYLTSHTQKTQLEYLQRGIILTSIACALIVGIIAAHFLARLVISTLICVSITALSVLAASLICGYLFWQKSNIKNINTMLLQIVEAITKHSSSRVQTSTGSEESVKEAVAAINPVFSPSPRLKGAPRWPASPSSFFSPTPAKLGLMTGSSPDANVLSPDPDLFPPPPAGRHFSSQRK